VLRELPFREVTVEAVMNRTGLKRPAFYVHFRDRHDLVLRVVEHIGRELFEMSNRWFKGDDPLADARAALEGIASVYVHHGPVLRALADASGADSRSSVPTTGSSRSSSTRRPGTSEKSKTAVAADPSPTSTRQPAR
jgi:AcrR family transcriptional regulator